MKSEAAVAMQKDPGIPVDVPSTLTSREIQISVQSKVEGFMGSLTVAPKFFLRGVVCEIFEDRASAAGWGARVEVDLRQIEVASSRTGRLKRAEIEHIERQVQTQLFDFEQNPIAKLDIRNVIPLRAANGEGVFLRGELELNGVRHHVAFPLLKRKSGNYETRFTVKQSDFGFVPLSTMGGVIRAKDEIEIVVEYRPAKAWT